MKTILVLTDFSENAKYATTAALFLAEQFKMDLLLFNIYGSFPVAPLTRDSSWNENYENLKKESQDQLNQEISRLKDRLKNTTSLPVISSVNAFGDLSDYLLKANKRRDIKLIAMGSRKKNTDNLLFGHDLTGAIKKANKPILIMPNLKKEFKLQSMVFATDLSKEDLMPIKLLTRFAETFNFRIYVTHVSGPAFIPDLREEEHITEFMKKINKLNAKHIIYQNLHGDNIIEELDNYNKSVKADVMVIVHKKHSTFWRLFNYSPLGALLNTQKIPLLIMPS